MEDALNSGRQALITSRKVARLPAIWYSTDDSGL